MTQMMKVSGRATKVHTDSQGLTSVVYYDTAVVRFNDTFIELDTGGWMTVTTKARMNQASNQYDLGYVVYQEDFDWFVTYRGHTMQFCRRVTLDRINCSILAGV